MTTTQKPSIARGLYTRNINEWTRNLAGYERKMEGQRAQGENTQNTERLIAISVETIERLKAGRAQVIG